MKEKFARFSDKVAYWAGSPYVVVGTIATVIIWLFSGPLLGFSDTWQLVINTATTIFTWILVHILQGSQNRSDKAIQTKLDTILKYLEASGADESIGIEDLSEEDIDSLHDKLRN